MFSFYPQAEGFRIPARIKKLNNVPRYLRYCLPAVNKIK